MQSMVLLGFNQFVPSSEILPIYWAIKEVDALQDLELFGVLMNSNDRLYEIENKNPDTKDPSAFDFGVLNKNRKQNTSLLTLRAGTRWETSAECKSGSMENTLPEGSASTTLNSYAFSKYE